MNGKNGLGKAISRDIQLYVLLLPAVLLTFVFAYLPLPGILLSFMDYDIFKQFSSPWVGFSNIIYIFKTPMFGSAILNTLTISVLTLVIVFPAPIIFALLLSELKNLFFKRFVQTVSYLPQFLSWLAVIGLATSMYSIYGPINDLFMWLGGEERIMFLANQSLFIPNLVFLNLWKTVGWDSIIYLAAITGIDSALYESAKIDGANRFRQIIHITVPGITPTILILFILAMGRLFNDNFELVYGLQNPFINFEVISTVVYKNGIVEGKYSIATAFGFVQGIIAFTLIAISNKITRKISEVSIW